MRRLKLVMRWLLAILFVLAGANHFRDPDLYLRMMPPYLPWHLPLVYVSGVSEIALGIMLLIPGCTRLAAWGLIALLVAVFPANVQMAMHPQDWADLFTPLALYARLPMQAVLIAWAFWFTRPEATPK